MYTRKHINDLPISILIFLSNSLFLASSLLSLTLLRSQIHTSDLVYKTLISNPLLVAKAVFAASPINNKGGKFVYFIVFSLKIELYFILHGFRQGVIFPEENIYKRMDQLKSPAEMSFSLS